MARTAWLVCFISTVNGRSNKKRKRKEEAYPWKTGPSSGHTTNLKQSILETFDIYDFNQHLYHRHLSDIDCLTAWTACLVCFISTFNGHSKKRLKMWC